MTAPGRIFSQTCGDNKPFNFYLSLKLCHHQLSQRLQTRWKAVCSPSPSSSWSSSADFEVPDFIPVLKELPFKARAVQEIPQHVLRKEMSTSKKLEKDHLINVQNFLIVRHNARHARQESFPAVRVVAPCDPIEIVQSRLIVEDVF